MRRDALARILILLIVVLPPTLRPPLAAAQVTGPVTAKVCDATVGVGETIFTNYTLSHLVSGAHYAVLSATDDAGSPSTADDVPLTFTGGDTNGNGTLDAGEEWLYAGSHAAGFTPGPLTDTATFSGTVSFDPRWMAPGALFGDGSSERPAIGAPAHDDAVFSAQTGLTWMSTASCTTQVIGPPTPTPTNTPVPPTNTPVPPTNTPTNTPVPPTITPTNGPTNTPVPPTNTPNEHPRPRPRPHPRPHPRPLPHGYAYQHLHLDAH